MRLLAFHPMVAARSCDDCRAYLYDDGPQGFGRRVDRPKGSGRWQKRLPLQLTPCSTCPKVPDESRESQTLTCDQKRAIGQASDLSPKNRKALEHYRRCRAVGRFPVDPIVERNAAIIREIEDAAGIGMLVSKFDLFISLLSTRRI